VHGRDQLRQLVTWAYVAACVSVRLDRSLLPDAIWDEAEAIVSVPVLTFATMSVRPRRIAFIACIMLAGPARETSTGYVN
jgi:hypothetical protein